jgi:glutathione S-transferase
MNYKLFLGNKAYSSWSLRGFLLFDAFEIPFEQQIVPLHTDRFEDFKEDKFPARQVPTLIVEDDDDLLTIWDSLSIAEYLHEQHPEAGIWPSARQSRAAARSLCAEMHASFPSLRATMPMNLRRSYATFEPDDNTAVDIKRIFELWAWAKGNWGNNGPYLFGTRFTAADAFFAPIASRFETYGIALDTPSQSYRDALLTHPSVVRFYQAAAAEEWILAHNELAIE